MPRFSIAAVLSLALASCASTPKDGPALAAGTNGAFAHEITTSAPPEAIWRLWTDVTTWPAWDKGLKGARADGPLALGSMGTIVPLEGPDARFRVTAFEPGLAYAFATELPLASLTVTRRLTGKNPTRFRHEVRFDGLLAPIWAAQFGPQFRAALPPTMEALAAQAESRTP